jgi:hypothetical protein
MNGGEMMPSALNPPIRIKKAEADETLTDTSAISNWVCAKHEEMRAIGDVAEIRRYPRIRATIAIARHRTLSPQAPERR